MEPIEVEVHGVNVHKITEQHVVLLKERGGDRVLPIWISADSGHAIANHLAGIASERPMTHDLVVSLLAALGGRFDRLIVHSLTPFEEGKPQGVFIASLYARAADGTESALDCRPSDGIAVAVRTGIPIFVTSEVFTRSAIAQGGSPT
jgi:bifunctional DNase/RNase